MSSLASRVSVVVVLEASIALAAFALFDDRILAWQAAARYSGRLSLAIFGLIVIADAHPQGVAARVLSTRPYHVLACAHLIHLGFLLTYLTLSQRFPPAPRLAGGFLGYVMIVAMPPLHASYLRGGVSSLAFRRLRIVYLSYVGFVMLATYAARLTGQSSFGGERSHYIALITFTILLGVWRLVVARGAHVLSRSDVDD